MNPNVVMNEPTISTSANTDLQMELDSNSLRLFMDRNGTQKFIVIDALQFLRHNGITTRIISWEHLHDKIEQLVASTFPPNATTFTAINSIQAQSGNPAETITMFQNGSSSELIGTDTLTLTSQTDLIINATTGLIRNLTGAEFNMTAGNITDTASLNGVLDNVLILETAGVAGRVRITTNTNQDTTQNNLGDIVQSNKGGSQQQVGSLYNAGIRGQLVNVVGGGAGFGDFVPQVFASGLNDGLGHSLNFVLSLDTSKYLLNWGVPLGTGDITSFGCRMVIRLPDVNSFICPFIEPDQPAIQPDINYYRITYYGDTFSNPIWVNEGASSGVQIPALQTNRFFANSTMTIEWSCSLVQNSSLANLAPLAYKCRVVGIDSSQEIVRAEVVCNWLNHPLPQATNFSPAIAYETSPPQEIISAEFWSNGCPFGL